MPTHSTFSALLYICAWALFFVVLQYFLHRAYLRISGAIRPFPNRRMTHFFPLILGISLTVLVVASQNWMVTLIDNQDTRFLLSYIFTLAFTSELMRFGGMPQK